MEFQKYSSLSIAQKPKVINAAIDAGHSNLMYGVTEKIHGANFGIHWDSETDTIQFSRRTGYLEEGEVFYAHTKIESALRSRMEIAVQLIKDARPLRQVTKVVVYGEIYGGGLNGATSQGSKRVQKEVQYSPETQFAAFDLIVDDVYAPQAVSFSVLTAAGFHMVPLLALYESLEDALRHPNDGQSVVPALLGYEVEADNIIEGVVIRPWNEDIHLFNGTHFILKNKNNKFFETSVAIAKVELPALEGVDKVLLFGAAQYITDNRLNAVISKEKELTHKDFGRIMGLLVKDALEEYQEDRADEYGEGFTVKARAEDWVRVNKELNKVATVLVRQYWINEL